MLDRSFLLAMTGGGVVMHEFDVAGSLGRRCARTSFDASRHKSQCPLGTSKIALPGL